MFHSQKQHHLDAKDSPASAGGGALRLTDDKFVGWMPEPETNETKVPRGIPRLLHKKSKTGCQRCRARRVKVQFPFHESSIPSIPFIRSMAFRQAGPTPVLVSEYFILFIWDLS